ncbi:MULTISPECIES: glycosyltransferase family 2 protein [Acidobacterium]|uniref:Glycosyl transferase, group 2 family n=1 Tax=Acidobacterium capsulatum (strain ATCC 51196 / DSM 11244 / BCRC 80197 / JCM 7670 / NBRC 15755 / NCIMB 13165 / 161) TaxID=240015 RepID=C1F4J4_ACIC5|nr:MULTISPECIES: glycosyltransferase family 2 protein [Acidobacterium]ACO33665.1 glycosyl transferase, group 2 family [Acidobacterium capsulatum ATCC 51196]HCT61814.1 family 2 glycosyl transferase [Acidobacterium sp.]
MKLFWLAVSIGNWMLALGWTWRVLTALYHLPRVPDLREDRYAAPPQQDRTPRLTVVVPARNEAAAVEGTLRSLLAQEMPLDIIAVDDRSEDATGSIMDRVAAEALPEGKTLRVIHVTELPEGWLGKNHALALAARQATTPWMLFTDGDIFFSPDALPRALHHAESVRADHFVLLPTPILLTNGERMMMSFIQVAAAAGGRLWRVSDPAAKSESIGVGAFNMVRREAYDGIGGFEAMRMEVLEDLRFGYLVKSSGYQQGVAFGPGMVRVHWAPGMVGILHNLTKNAFAVFRFQLPLILAACFGMMLAFLLPVVGWFGPLECRVASAMVAITIFLIYRFHRGFNDFRWWGFLTFPVAGSLFIYAVLRSTLLTLWRGGVVWRGTFYPLRELRQQLGRLR